MSRAGPQGFLFDTEVLLWALAEPGRLGAPARRLLEREPGHASVASLWEIGTLQARGRLALPSASLVDEVERAGARWLALTPAHMQAAAALGVDWTDPFDRLLVATARVERLMFVTRDAALIDAAGPLLGGLLLAA